MQFETTYKLTEEDIKNAIIAYLKINGHIEGMEKVNVSLVANAKYDMRDVVVGHYVTASATVEKNSI